MNVHSPNQDRVAQSMNPTELKQSNQSTSTKAMKTTAVALLAIAAGLSLGIPGVGLVAAVPLGIVGLIFFAIYSVQKNRESGETAEPKAEPEVLPEDPKPLKVDAKIPQMKGQEVQKNDGTDHAHALADNGKVAKKIKELKAKMHANEEGRGICQARIATLNDSLKEQVSILIPNQNKLAVLEEELAKLRNELEDWREMESKNENAQYAESVPKKIAEVEKDLVAKKNEIKDLQQKIKELEKSSVTYSLRLGGWERTENELNESLQEKEKMVTELQKKSGELGKTKTYLRV